MPPKPACKAVKRTLSGQRGARIHPKGCTVRTTVNTTTGIKTRTNKAGQIKRKTKTTGDEFRVRVKSVPNSNVSVPMLWDTGAGIDTISHADAVKLNILNRPHYPSAIEGAGDIVHNSFELRNVPLWVRLTTGTPSTRIVSRQLFITPGRRSHTSNVIGTPTIKQLSKVLLKVKFTEMKF